MRSLLIGIILGLLSTVSVAQTSQLKWLLIEQSRDGNVQVFLDVTTFDFDTGKDLDETIVFAKIRIADKRPEYGTKVGSAFVNMTGCLDKSGKLIIMLENKTNPDFYAWRSDGTAIVDSIGEALCKLYDVAQKRRM